MKNAYDSETKSEEIVALGQISSVDIASGTARVAFDSLDNMVSGDLPVLRNAGGNVSINYMPVVGDHVVVLRLPQGESDGFILGTYSTTDNPHGGSEDALSIASENGRTFIEVTQDGINIMGSVRILGSLGVDGNISCNGLTVEGDASITGSLTVGGDIRNDGNMRTGGTHTDSVGRHS